MNVDNLMKEALANIDKDEELKKKMNSYNVKNNELKPQSGRTNKKKKKGVSLGGKNKMLKIVIPLISVIESLLQQQNQGTSKMGIKPIVKDPNKDLMDISLDNVFATFESEKQNINVVDGDKEFNIEIEPGKIYTTIKPELYRGNLETVKENIEGDKLIEQIRAQLKPLEEHNLLDNYNLDNEKAEISKHINPSLRNVSEKKEIEREGGVYVPKPYKLRIPVKGGQFIEYNIKFPSGLEHSRKGKGNKGNLFVKTNPERIAKSTFNKLSEKGYFLGDMSSRIRIDDNRYNDKVMLRSNILELKPVEQKAIDVQLVPQDVGGRINVDFNLKDELKNTGDMLAIKDVENTLSGAVGNEEEIEDIDEGGMFQPTKEEKQTILTEEEKQAIPTEEEAENFLKGGSKELDRKIQMKKEIEAIKKKEEEKDKASIITEEKLEQYRKQDEIRKEKEKDKELIDVEFLKKNNAIKELDNSLNLGKIIPAKQRTNKDVLQDRKQFLEDKKRRTNKLYNELTADINNKEYLREIDMKHHYIMSRYADEYKSITELLDNILTPKKKDSPVKKLWGRVSQYLPINYGGEEEAEPQKGEGELTIDTTTKSTTKENVPKTPTSKTPTTPIRKRKRSSSVKSESTRMPLDEKVASDRTILTKVAKELPKIDENFIQTYMKDEPFDYDKLKSYLQKFNLKSAEANEYLIAKYLNKTYSANNKIMMKALGDKEQKSFKKIYESNYALPAKNVMEKYKNKKADLGTKKALELKYPEIIYKAAL